KDRTGSIGLSAALSANAYLTEAQVPDDWTLEVKPISALRAMAPDAIVFALANPTPEVMPEDAAKFVRIVATGRSDYANQINNVLVFPGIFRGALDCRASDINEAMKLAAAHAIADIIPEEELRDDYIIPSVFNRKVAPAVAKAVIQAAYETGVARRERRSLELETI
ncbi:MAG: malic enzyme-like NAD(P)-binding protein, partial [Candidatus Sericytochromatia bacterium]